MASMKNNVSLIGNLGKDPEVKEFGTNRKASFSLATTEKYNNSKGEKRYVTEIVVDELLMLDGSRQAA